MTGVFAVTALPCLNLKTHTRRERVAKPAEFELSNGTQTAAVIKPLTDGAPSVESSLKYFNHASSPAGQIASHSQTPNVKPEDDITIIPKIDVFVSAPHLWADGQTPAVVSSYSKL
ncbi:MAG TPA: hypothetical protein DC054_09310 [Blastocatellia bacterium]|nr:hypothetical protein [Blastocatellia bacterium]